MENLIFKLNKKLDVQMISSFLSYGEQGGINFSGCVLKPNPGLAKELKKGTGNRASVISEYVDYVYRTRKKILNIRLKEFGQRWSKLERDYFSLVKGIFKLKKLPDYKYVGFLSIINCGPRFLEDRSFQVFYRRPKDSMYVTMHEILHFFFYDYVVKRYPKIFKKLDKNRGIFWALAEAFNSVILFESEFKKIHKQTRDWSYPALRKHIPELRQYWKKTKDIDNWILKSFEYLKKTTN